MRHRQRLAWLGLTPEPERELPRLVAALRRDDPDGVRTERDRVEGLVLRGSRRGWLRYLHEVLVLVQEVAAGRRPGDPAVALLVTEIVLDHHRLLIGIPGPGYDATAADRAALEETARGLRARLTTEEVSR
ncbi:hypothetical protein GCM10029978_026240 [Actinoallomurus acanthiterrae]